MSSNFQVEFPLSNSFQSRLKKLSDRFIDLHGKHVKVSEITAMCLKALPDITPELIDQSEKDEAGKPSENIFRKTTNINGDDRKLLEEIKLSLLLNHKRDFTRQDIMRGIIFTASGLRESDLTYILSEFHYEK